MRTSSPALRSSRRDRAHRFGCTVHDREFVLLASREFCEQITVFVERFVAPARIFLIFESGPALHIISYGLNDWTRSDTEASVVQISPPVG